MNKFVPTKLLFFCATAILTACGTAQDQDQANVSPRQEAILLQDSAVKQMKAPVGSTAFDESLKLLNQAIKIDPKLKSAYYHKMQYFLKKGDTDEAFRTRVAANKAMPGDAIATLNIGIEYEKRDSLRKAKAKYREAVTLFENILDTIDTNSGLIRNTYILNLALASILANTDGESKSLDLGLSEPERENLDIALNTLKGMTREDLLHLHKNE